MFKKNEFNECIQCTSDYIRFGLFVHKKEEVIYECGHGTDRVMET